MNPKISVVMSVCNGEKYLRESINSILRQTFEDFEFIIVDDGSTDNSQQIIRSFNDKRIKLLIHEENLGLTKSLNDGIKEAKGEYIVRQDADDISFPERLDDQIKYMEERLWVALIGTGCYVLSYFKHERRPARRDPREELMNRNCIYHGTVMMRKSVLDALGLYNENLKYAQDYELWLRIAKHYEVRNIPSPLYVLRYHKDSLSSKKIEEQQLDAALARKIVLDSVNNNLLLAYQRDPWNLYKLLTKKEKILFHNALAYSYSQFGDIKSVRRECWKSMMLRDNFESAITLFFSLFGTRGVHFLHQFYRLFRR